MILMSHFVALDLIPKLSTAHICKSPVSSVMQHNAEQFNKTILPLNLQKQKPQAQNNKKFYVLSLVLQKSLILK